MRVTTVAPEPSRSAILSAATTLAPVDVPAKIASSLASLRAMAFASSVDTVRILTVHAINVKARCLGDVFG